MKPATALVFVGLSLLSSQLDAVCGPDYSVTAVHAVQGSRAVSPVVGRLVTIEGIVVGDFQDRFSSHGDLDGFAVQEQWLDSDLDPLTSEGIFVYDGSMPATDVVVGDRVCVRGRVVEFFGETRINVTTWEGAVTVVGRGYPLPKPLQIRLPVSGTMINDDGRMIGDYERYEGQRVRVVGPLHVNDLSNLDRFGEMTATSGGRLFAFTQWNAPDPVGFSVWTQAAVQRSLTLDDGFSTSWPDPIPYPPPGLSLTNQVRNGDSIDGVVGVITYRRGDGADGEQVFRLMPTQTPLIINQNPRPLHAPLVRGDVTVASINLRFFSNGIGGHPGSFPIGGGRTTFNEYLRQSDKLVATIAEMNADIVGLMELENDYLDGGGSTIADLVNALNAILGSGAYAYLDPNHGFGSAPLITGILYKPETVAPVGPLVWLYNNRFANPNGNIFKLNRPALTQTFDSAIGPFTVSVNHLKSKGCSPAPWGLDKDQFDGQSCFNDTRAKGATELINWLANDPTDTAAYLGASDPDVLIIGDLNAYPNEDPILAIKAGWDGVEGSADDWTDLLDPVDYSFVFRGQAGRLDHAIASPSLAPQISSAEIWHINADESAAFDYSEDHPAPAALYSPDPFRSSDHDVVLIGLKRTP